MERPANTARYVHLHYGTFPPNVTVDFMETELEEFKPVGMVTLIVVILVWDDSSEISLHCACDI